MELREAEYLDGGDLLGLWSAYQMSLPAGGYLYQSLFSNAWLKMQAAFP